MIGKKTVKNGKITILYVLYRPNSTVDFSVLVPEFVPQY